MFSFWNKGIRYVIENLYRTLRSFLIFPLKFVTSTKFTMLLWKILLPPHKKQIHSSRIDLINNLTHIKRILLIRLDEIGDVVLTTPLCRELRRNCPTAYIAIVVRPQLLNLIETCPYVDEVLTFDVDVTFTFDWSVRGRLTDLKLQWRALKFARKKLWPKHYDLAILPRYDIDYYCGSYVVYFSGASWRIGYSEKVTQSKKCDNGGYDGLFSHTLIATDQKHEVGKNLGMITLLGGQVKEDTTELWLTREDKDSAKEIFDKNSIYSDLNQIIAFCPVAKFPNRRWPLSNFVDLGRILNQYQNIRILVIGGPNEEHYGKWLVRNLSDKVINLVGKLTLRQTAAVLEKCNLYVGNDTGPMHLAAAVGTPVVEISRHPIEGLPQHMNSPERFGPWNVPSKVLQPRKAVSPCSDSCTAKEAHCICMVEVDQVAEAMFQLIPKICNQ
jgi:ADP-heptose:LPS heptosyltransferase